MKKFTFLTILVFLIMASCGRPEPGSDILRLTAGNSKPGMICNGPLPLTMTAMEDYGQRTVMGGPGFRGL